MRTRSLTVLTAIAAVTMVVAGCDEALIGAKGPAKLTARPAVIERPLGPQPRLIQQLLDTVSPAGVAAAEGLPTAPIWDIAQAADNEHATVRGLVSLLAHPVLGKAPVVGQPVRFDGVKPLAASAAPRLGGDLAAVLKEFGLEERA